MASTKKRIEIVGGPSKFDFLETIEFRKYPQQHVSFKIVDEGKERELVTEVSTITPHDHSGKLPGEEGHEWFFLGGMRELHRDFPPSSWIRGKYSTKTRTGWVEEISLKEARLIDRLLEGK